MVKRKTPRDLRDGLANVFSGKVPEAADSSSQDEALLHPEPSLQDAARQGGAPALLVAQQTAGLLGEAERLRAENKQLKANSAVSLDPNHIEDFWPTDRSREAFCDPSFEELCRSIEFYGQDQAITVRLHPENLERYQIACGRRRREACRALGRPVLAVIRPLSDDMLLQIMLRENQERTDPSLYERGIFIRAMQKRLSLSVRALAGRLKLSPGYVSRLARLPELDPQLCQLIGDPRPLSMRMLEKLAETFGGDDHSPAAQARLDQAIAKWGSIRPAADADGRARQLIKLAASNSGDEMPQSSKLLRNDAQRVIGQLKFNKNGSRRIDLAADLDQSEIDSIIQALEQTAF